MRKFLYGVAATFATLVLLVLGLFAYVAIVGSDVGKDGLRYADDAVIAITSRWDAQELRRRATPELLRQTAPADLDNLFVWFATLGPLVDYQGAKLVGATQFASGTAGSWAQASYLAAATYKNGAATIQIELRKADDAWRVNGFHVNSSKLLENRVGKGT
jgi:hypothetical protein